MRYKAFLSYSHADDELAANLEVALQRFGRPWYRLRAFRVFRDKSGLGVSNALWRSIQSSLRDSEYLLLIASPEAAQSPWVNKEIKWWIENKTKEKLLILVAGGQIAWDYDKNCFDQNRTNNLPEFLQKLWRDEPLFVDLRGLRNERNRRRRKRFIEAIAEISATLHGKSKDELHGLHIRQRRIVRIGVFFGTTSFVLVAVFAIHQWQTASSRDLASHSAGMLPVDPVGALSLAIEANRTAETYEAKRALFSALHHQRTRAIFPHQVESFPAKLSPDGAKLLTAGGPRNLSLWDLATGERILSTEGYDASFSPDGSKMVIVNDDRDVLLFDNRSGPFLQSFALDVHHVRQAAFVPDGSGIITVKNEGTIELWDSNAGKRLASSTSSNQGSARLMGFSSTGRFLVSESHGAVVGRNSKTTRALGVLKDPESTIYHAVFSPDGLNIVTTANGPRARIWNAKTWKEAKELENPTKGFEKAWFSPSGDSLLTSHFDNTATLWDTENWQEITVLQGHRGWIFDAVFSPDGTQIATAAGDNTCRLWEVKSGRALKIFRGHRDRVSQVDFSSGATLLMTASRDGTARIWERERGWEVLSLDGHKNSITDAKFSPNGSRLLTASTDGTARLWDMADGTEIFVLKGHQQTVWRVDFSADGKQMLTAGNDGTVRIWNATTGRQERLLDHGSPVTKTLFASESVRILTVASDGTARIWNALESDKPLAIKGLAGAPIKKAALSHDRRKAIITNDSSAAAIFEFQSESFQHMFECPDGDFLKEAIFSPDDHLTSFACSSGSQGAIYVQNASGSSKYKLAGHRGIREIAFSADSELLLATSYDGKVHIWDLDTGKPKLTLEPERLGCAAFSPDTSMIVAGEFLYEAGTGRELYHFQDQRPICLFSPNGSSTATIQGNNVLLYYIGLEKLLPHAQSLLPIVHELPAPRTE